MKNAETWKPSKYEFRAGALTASRDSTQVSVASRLVTDIVASYYSRALPVHASGRLLDLGCGKVPLYQSYVSRVDEVVCVDWQNTLHKNNYLDYECDLTKPLPFADQRFDTVILSDVLEHIPEPELLCEEIARVLSTGGKLIMNVPFYYGLHEQPHDFHRYTEHALRRLMDRCGLKPIQLESIGGVPEIISDLLAKNSMGLKYGGRKLATFFQWFAGWFIRTRLGRSSSNRSKATYPFGYFMVAERIAREQRNGQAAPFPAEAI